jgi:hypothetical protein
MGKMIEDQEEEMMMMMMMTIMMMMMELMSPMERKMRCPSG